MGPHTIAGWLGLALSAVAILVVLRRQAPHSLLRLQFSGTPVDEGSLRKLYIHTVKHSVTGFLLQTPGYSHYGPTSGLKQHEFVEERRRNGQDWPVSGAYCMLRTTH